MNAQQEKSAIDIIKQGIQLHLKSYLINFSYIAPLIFIYCIFFAITLGDPKVMASMMQNIPVLLSMISLNVILEMVVLIWIYNVLSQSQQGHECGWQQANHNMKHSMITLIIWSLIFIGVLLLIFGLIFGLSFLMPAAEVQVTTTTSAGTVERTISEGVVADLAGQIGGGFAMFSIVGILIVPTFIYLSIRLALLPIVVILEKADVKTSWKRSFALTKNRFFKTLGILLLVMILQTLIMFLFELAISNRFLLYILDTALFFAFTPAVLVIYYQSIKDST